MRVTAAQQDHLEDRVHRTLIGLGRFGSAVFDDFTNEIYGCRKLKLPIRVVGQANAAYRTLILL